MQPRHTEAFALLMECASIRRSYRSINETGFYERFSKSNEYHRAYNRQKRDEALAKMEKLIAYLMNNFKHPEVPPSSKEMAEVRELFDNPKESMAEVYRRVSDFDDSTFVVFIMRLGLSYHKLEVNTDSDAWKSFRDKYETIVLEA